MAQTQLNRVYVQSIDGTGIGVNALNIGTKSMTRSVTIGGVGTANNVITVDTSGVRINTSTTLGGTTTIPNLNATTAIVSGNTSLQNTSTLNLGVRGNASITNASINKLQVVGHTDLGNTSITNLEVTSGVKFENANLTGTLSVTGLTTLINVSTTSLSVLNNVSIGGNVSIIGNMRSFSLETGNASVNGTLNVAGKSHLQNTSNSGVLDVVGKTTLGVLDVNGQSTIRAGLTVTGAVNVTNTFSASTLSITGETILKNVSLTSLTVSGNTSLNNVSMAGVVDINTFGTGVTTIGGASSRTVMVNTSINGVVDINVTGTTTTKIGNTILGSCTAIGNASINGSVDINAKGIYTTTIGNTTIGSRTVIGNASINGSVDINVTGTTTTRIGNTTLGSCTVIGNTSMNGSVDINAKGIYTTTIGNTQIGSRTVIGNTSMNGSVDINTSGTGNTTIGSATSSTAVKGDLTVTKILTSGYSPSLYNYAPTFFATVTGGNVSTSTGPEYGFTLTGTTASVSSISAVSLVANKKYILNFNARTEGGTPTVTILGTPFALSTTNTNYRQVITAPTTTSTLGIAISGVATNKIIWSLLTIEPYYDMTLGSDLFSIAGDINVSAATPFTDWDPSRMLFTPSSITVGANPRIAVGRNNTLNVSLYVATCEVTSANANYITSIDGLNWNQTSLSTIGVTNPRGLVYHENTSVFFMVTGESPAKVYSNTTGNATWTQITTSPSPLVMGSVTNMIYANNYMIAFNAAVSSNVMHSTTGVTWTIHSNIAMSIADMAYGKMAGAFVTVACGTNAFYRNSTLIPDTHDPIEWLPATGFQIGNWAFVGFGNDTFIAVSNDATGKVTRSENAGVNWLTPVFLNESLTSRPIYVENTWFIGSNTGVYVSKDNGLTWTKRVGNTLTRSVFSGKFVDIGTSLSLITKRNQRIDGSNIAPDTITLGLEGSTTTAETIVVSKVNATTVHATTVNVSTIGYGASNTVSLAGMVNVSMGIPTTAFTFTPSSVVASNTRIAYGNGKFVVIGDGDTGKVFHSSNGTSWTQVTNPTFSGSMKSVVYANDRFMIVTESSPTNVYTLLNVDTKWTLVAIPGTKPNVNLSRCAYGNTFVVGISNFNSTPVASVSSDTTGTVWTNVNLPGGTVPTGIGFGTMSTGLNRNVFLIVGANSIRRNTGTTVLTLTTPLSWELATNIPTGNWAYVGFANDTFMVTSSDGNLTISVDGGKTWSNSVSFGITLRTPTYFEGEWYIGSDSGFMMISKNNGITWERKPGPDMFEFANGAPTLVSVNNNATTTNRINVIGVKKARDDGSNIVSDTIMIGREGSTTTIGSDSLVVSKVTASNASVTNMTVNTMNASTVNVSTIGFGAFNQVSIAGLVNVSMGNPITTFTFTPNSVAAQYSRIAFGNNTFVIIGETGKVFYSTNGTTWTASTPPSPTFVGGMKAVLYTNNSFFILTENEPAANVYTSTNGISWAKLGPVASYSIFHASYGFSNGNHTILGIKQNTGAISITIDAGANWSGTTLTIGTPLLTGTAFGTMSNTTNGTNVFLIFGTNFIKRNPDAPLNVEGNWYAPTTTPTGTWAYGGFGNDTFVLTSSDSDGRLTLSRDGGKTWSVPINFGITLRKPINFNDEWYIGSDSGFMMVSKNNGLSWEKRTAPDIFEFASGAGKLLSVNNGPLASNLIHVIGLKKVREDGSSIITDTITIGREGSTTTIDNLVTSNIGFGAKNTLSIAGNVNVSMGNPVTELLSSFTPTIIPGFVNQQARIAYGNGKFVLIGDTSKVYHSSNGTTWTQVTSPTFAGNMRTVLFVKDKFMIVSEITPVVVHTSTDGAVWNPVTTTTPLTTSVIFAASYGNDIIVGITPVTGTIYTSSLAGASWPQISLGSVKLYGVVFGTMSTATNGTNVFIVFGENIIRRNEGSPASLGPWTTLTPTGADSPGTLWYHGGFGNDTFMLTSTDPVTLSNPGLLTISRDAGKTWSTPITFGITLRQPIYVEGVWYIASENDCMMISKDNGVTWEKRTTGIKSWFFSYGNGLFLTTHVSNTNTVINLIGSKTKRDDGSLITSDTITIGREGTTTTIASNSLAVSKINVGSSNTLSIASNVNVSMGSPTTLFTFTPSGITVTVARIAYGNGKFVVIGDTAKVYHSSNGTTWTQVTSPTFPGAMRTVLYANDKFMIFSETVTNVIYTSPDGAIWNTVTVNTQPSSYMYSVAYGNNSLVGITPNTGSIHVSTSTPLGSIWSSVTIPGGLLFFIAAFGKMTNTANGTNVFIVAGKNNLIRRNEGTASGTWSEPTTYPSISGNWQLCGFGNDTFMITSQDPVGLLTISRDAGKTWSTPIDFGIELAQPIYVDGDWYIGSQSGFTMISKNNGVTWEKRGSPGIKIDRFAYGNGMLVSAADNISYLINFKKKREDGSLITLDAITIGREGTTTTIKGVIDVDGGMIVKTGYVGIGTTSPQYPLHVNGLINTPILYGNQMTFFYFSGSAGIQSATLTANGYIGNVTIAAENNILTFGTFVASSDRRIKTNIVDIEDDRALRDLRLLKPKTYTYKDVVQKGSTPVYGFIAQEVKEVLNYASSYITETLPNVYELATFSGDILTLTFNTADLSRDASGSLFTKLKLKTREEKDEFVNIIEIIDAHTLRVDKDLTCWGGQLVGDQIVPGNRIFVYGQEVSDFHTMNKDAIWTVATAALQEVDRQLQAEKQKTALMQTALDSLLENKTEYDAKILNLEARLLALEQKNV